MLGLFLLLVFLLQQKLKSRYTVKQSWSDRHPIFFQIGQTTVIVVLPWVLIPALLKQAFRHHVITADSTLLETQRLMKVMQPVVDIFQDVTGAV